MGDVKRYSIDGLLAYPPLEGETVVVLASDYAALEAKYADLRAGQEPVAVVDKHIPSAEIQWTE